jgi:3-(3-hydroxy-phenyl)propionate hydroxylase
VVVVGAGPAGVTVATLLAQQGVSCLILERHPDIYPQPRAVHCDDEVCRILDRLGIYGEFAKIWRPSLGVRLVDPDLRLLKEIPVPHDGVHGFPRANMYDQPELEKLLRAKYSEQPGCELRGNAEVTAVEQLRDSVRVSYTDRETNATHTVDAQYVLGADGANSTVRAAIGGRMESLHFEQRWLVIDVDSDTELKHWDGTHQVCSPERAGTYLRVGDTRYRWEFQLLDGESAADYKTLDAVAPLVSPWLGQVGLDDLSLVRVAEYTFRAQVAPRWRRRNVFLLGDAAHTTPPFIGQGLCAGLRDAQNLSWKLAGVLDGNLPDSALDTYQQEREPHVRRLIRMSIGLGQMMTAGGRRAAVSRRVLFPAMFRVPLLQTFILAGFTPSLHQSAYVVKTRRRDDLAGRLCPNPLVPSGVRLDSVIAGRFGLITSVPLTQTQQRELDRRNAVTITTPPGSELAEWLARGHATAAIVRPDGIVMQAGSDVAALCRAVPALGAPRSSTAPALLVLNVGKQALQAVSLRTAEVRNLVEGLDERPDGIAVDPIRRHVYWTNMGPPDPGMGPKSQEAFTRNASLERASLDGTHRDTVVPRGAFTSGKQLTADFETGKLYWCDREGMRVLYSNLDGSDLRALVIVGEGDDAAHDATNHCVGIAVDLNRRLIYWTQKGAPNANQGRIFRAPLDSRPGVAPDQRDDIELLWDGLPEPVDLDLVADGTTLVWTDRSTEPNGNGLFRAAVQPSVGEPERVSTGHEEAIGVAAVSESEFYVSDLGGNIRHIDLKSGTDTVFARLGPGLTGLALLP